MIVTLRTSHVATGWPGASGRAGAGTELTGRYAVVEQEAAPTVTRTASPLSAYRYTSA